MLFREARLGFRTVENPSGLVVPVNVFDGDYFPEKARNIQFLDCRKYWLAGEGFAKTERYVEYQDLLKEWAPSVARAVQSAPAWNEDWLTNEWLDAADEELQPLSARNFRFVGLE